jgi:FkbM family methyltransferase
VSTAASASLLVAALVGTLQAGLIFWAAPGAAQLWGLDSSTVAHARAVDFMRVRALGALGLDAVYETARGYRTATLANIDRFLALERRLADDFSRETLYGILLFRLTYDRQAMHPVMVGPRDEYFTDGRVGSTFALGSNEHFCDCGAHEGTILARFLGATDWRYASVSAFEPDRRNFRQLQKFALLPLKHLKLSSKALSDRLETLHFAETGTMFSHVTESGGVEVKTTRLDDEIERVTFLKMDVEGYEARILAGGREVLGRNRPRMAIASYHYATDLLKIVDLVDELTPGYSMRLRQHANYYYDSILDASPEGGWQPPASAT